MGNGNQPVRYQIRPSVGDQVSSTLRLCCGVDQFRSEWIDELPDHWVMYFDGSYTLKGAVAGVVLIPPEGDILKYSIQVDFPATNNIA
jgi:hypothetical protein